MGREVRPYKGAGMEGWVGRWYAKTRRNDIEDFRRQARSVAGQFQGTCDVLEVAPGPGFFAVELAKLGNFKITGLDISQTLLAIARKNAAEAKVEVEFRHGNASAMPFADESFDLVYCSAAFKNFSEPVKALDEIHRVLRPGGTALIVDLRKDVSADAINRYVDQSGRSRLDAWLTRWTFRHVLIKRAYTRAELLEMAGRSRFGGCQIDCDLIGFEVRLSKPAVANAAVA